MTERREVTVRFCNAIACLQAHQSHIAYGGGDDLGFDAKAVVCRATGSSQDYGEKHGADAARKHGESFARWNLVSNLDILKALADKLGTTVMDLIEDGADVSREDVHLKVAWTGCHGECRSTPGFPATFKIGDSPATLYRGLDFMDSSDIPECAAAAAQHILDNLPDDQ